MKITELLTLNEYDSSITLQKWGGALSAPAKRENVSVEDALSALEAMDPTKNKQYMMWLLKQFTTNKFRLEDAPRITDVLKKFGSVKQRLPVNQRDIGRFSLHTLEDLVDSIFNAELGKKQESNTGRKIPEDAEVLYNGPLGLLVIPKSKDASCELGRGTKWCTAAKDHNMFDHYSEQGDLYIWIDKNGDKYQFHFEGYQFMDARDRELSREEIKYFRTEHPVLSKLFQEKEPIIAKNPKWSANYAVHVLHDRFPLGEEAIAQDHDASYRYAIHALGHQRFELGEPAIATNASTSYYYALDIIKGRFELGEPAIAKDAYGSYKYALDIIKGRFELGEPAIAKKARIAVKYARDVIKGRFEMAEELIASLAGGYYAEEYAEISEENYKAMIDLGVEFDD